ncbi:MAG TPA: DUF559 domain-containing protein [Patescibacteria group bacterium]|nr:DUF559 domain-containing protein [Patescibacteria group bacterium]
MSFLYNSESISKARSLRKNQTEAERFFWSKIRARQLSGYKFYRQYPIGRYIVDFYCPAKKLVVELDGSQHMKRKQYDQSRTEYLNKQSISVIRYWDNEVLKKTEEVLEGILRYLITSPQSSPYRRGRSR